jgi:hypothetical protein
VAWMSPCAPSHTRTWPCPSSGSPTTSPSSVRPFSPFPPSLPPCLPPSFFQCSPNKRLFVHLPPCLPPSLFPSRRLLRLRGRRAHHTCFRTGQRKAVVYCGPMHEWRGSYAGGDSVVDADGQGEEGREGGREGGRKRDIDIKRALTFSFPHLSRWLLLWRPCAAMAFPSCPSSSTPPTVRPLPPSFPPSLPPSLAPSLRPRH